MLAYADTSESSGQLLYALLVGCGAFIGAVLLAAIPLAIAHVRRHPRLAALLTGAVVWAIATAVAVYWTYLQQSDWSREYLIRIQSGYYDPNDLSAKPSPHPLLFTILAVAYLALFLLALSARGPANISEEAPSAGES